jgi:molecular chaperone GrpE
MTEKDKQAKNDKQAEPEKKDDASESEAMNPLELELEELRGQITELANQSAENMDGWQRNQAEFSNYKKRVARDQTMMQEDARGKVIRRYLEVLDDLERALKNAPAEGDGAEWANGVELVMRKMQSFLDADGVKPMKEVREFDPNMHEAIAQEESEDHESGQIIEVLQTGYTIGDRVLRPAVVKVAQ